RRRMRIDPSVEEPMRRLFGHALRAEFDDFQRRLGETDGAHISEAITLAAKITAYLCIEVCGGETPTDSDISEFAESAADVETRYELSATEVRDYLAKCVFGGQALHEVFQPEDAVRLPFVIGANLLGTYAKDEQNWWDYLDEI